MRRAVWLLLAAVTVAGILFLFVFPTRTLLQQDRQISATERQIAALQHENASLRRKAAELEDPARVEQIARSEYGMVSRGQRAYAVTPAPAPAPTTTTTPRTPGG